MLKKKTISKYDTSNLKTKNSFLLIYKNQLLFILKIIVMCLLIYTASIIIKTFDISIEKLALLFFIIVTISILTFCLTYSLYHYIIFFIHERKIPLTAKEINNLGITNPKEYAEFLREYLCGVFPNDQVYIRIVLSACNIFNMKHDFITSYAYLFENEKVKFEDIFETNIDIEDENKIVDLKNKIEISEGHYKHFKKLCKEVFKKTWLEKETNTTSESMDYFVCLLGGIIILLVLGRYILLR